MQLPQTCLFPNHYQEKKAIEFICLYPQCQLRRLLCSKCLWENIHKHNLQDNANIVDNIHFCSQIKEKLNLVKGQQQKKKYNIDESIVPLKKLILEMQNDLNNIQNMVELVEQGKFQNINIDHLEDQLQNIQKYGFNDIDDSSLNNLINIPQQYKDRDFYKQLEDQSNTIIQKALKMKEWHLSQVDNQIQLSQKIQNANYQIHQIDDKDIYTGAISNDLKYIISGGVDQLLNIWDQQSNEFIKSIELNNYVSTCKFTEDSTILYVGSYLYLYQFDVNDQFKELYKQDIHSDYINNIYCISNTKILTSSTDGTIIKTDVNKKQQLLIIQAHNKSIYGLDYNKSLNIIASGSYDQSIKLWNGNNGSLNIEKLNLNLISQVLFIINNNQLMSLDIQNNLIIWNINHHTRQLEQLQLIQESGDNISLILQQQYIIATGNKFIKVYSIKGEFVRQFDHEVEDVDILPFNIIQHESMKQVLIKGEYQLQVCKINMD